MVHNSTAKSLVVSGSTDLGTGITAPAQFTLAPGAVTFKFSPGFNHATARTVAGYFTFTGREGQQRDEP